MDMQNYLEFVQDPQNLLGIGMAIGFFVGNVFASIGYIGLELSEILNLKITDMREKRKTRREKERCNTNEN